MKPNIFVSAYERLIKAASLLQSPLLLLIRLYWGWSFFQTGLGKLQNLGPVTEFFQSLGLPLPGANAALVGSIECAGGLLLLVGFASRLAAIPLIVILIVAYSTAEIESLRAVFSDPDKFMAATPFLFLLACLIVFAFGPGAFSIDHLIAARRAGANRAAKAG